MEVCVILTPTHNESTSDRSRRVFGGVDRNTAGLGTHSNPEQKTADEKLWPGLSAGAADDRPEAEMSGKEDGSYIGLSITQC